MSDPINDGGPAFPEPGVYDALREQVNPVSAYYNAGWMTLRQYYKAAALQGLLTMPDQWAAFLRKDGCGTTWTAEIARASAHIADALIVEDVAFAAKAAKP